MGKKHSVAKRNKTHIEVVKREKERQAKLEAKRIKKSVMGIEKVVKKKRNHKLQKLAMVSKGKKKIVMSNAKASNDFLKIGKKKDEKMEEAS
mmetsp:Transcript_33289/g.48705  ORF Transcript_33289/g.48705 Transcript_33289/m.48705 type:complete len:92 (+) Transcript_33289:93-368(+)